MTIRFVPTEHYVSGPFQFVLDRAEDEVTDEEQR